MVLSSSSFSLWSSIFFICLPSDLVWREEKIHVAIPSPSHLRPAKAHICPCAAIFISSTCEISPRESVSSVRADSGPKRVNYLTYVEWITWMASDYTVLFSHLTCVFFSLSSSSRIQFDLQHWISSKHSALDFLGIHLMQWCDWCVCARATMHDGYVCEYSNVGNASAQIWRGVFANAKDTCCTLQIWWFSF